MSSNKFAWLGPSVECYNPGLADCPNFTFYNSFTLNNQCYRVNDFIILEKKHNGIYIIKLLTLFESKEKWHENAIYRGFGRLYSFANAFTDLIKDNKFVDNNEVIEDFINNYNFFSLEDIKSSCTLVIGSIEDPIHLIDHLKLDKLNHFSCRFTIHDDYLLTPILNNSSKSNLIDSETINNYFMRKIRLNKTKHNLENHDEVECLSSNKSSKTKHNLENHIHFECSSPNKLIKTKHNLEIHNEVECLSPNKLNKTKHNLENHINVECLSPNKLRKTKHNLVNHINVECFSPNKSNKTKHNLENHIKVECLSPNKLRKTIHNLENHISVESFSPNKSNKTKHNLENHIKVECSSPNKLRNTIHNLENHISVESFSPNKSDKTKHNLENHIKVECLSPNKLSKTKNSLKNNIKVECLSPNKLSKTKNNLKNHIKVEISSPNKLSETKMTPNRAKRNLTELFDNTQKSDLSIKREVNSLSNQPKVHLLNLTAKAIDELKRKIRNRCASLECDKLPPIKQLNDNQFTPKKIDPIRRSSRTVDRVSYADYDSPRRRFSTDTPKKLIKTPNRELRLPISRRTRSQSIDDVVVKTSLRNIRRLSLLHETDETPGKSVAIKLFKESKSPKRKIDNSACKTPKTNGRIKLIRQGIITPSVQSRETFIINDNTPLKQARAKLHVSYVPKALACRENEFADILGFVEGKLLDGCGGCMYVSGVPGTGKTATVTEVMKKLEEMVQKKDVPKFEYVSINGMRLTEPRQSYVEILKQLTGKTVAWEQAQTMLENKFTKKATNKKPLPVVLLVDELDILCTKRQDVVYNLLDWPTKASAQLIVITIANTMDLPERLLMGKVTSRLGLTRLTFQAYTHKQLQIIVAKRLTGTNAFNPDAIQLVARKVASVSGDARRALDICRRAAEVAEAEGPETLVSMGHVNEALNAMITQPKVRAIRNCSRLEQLLLQAVVAEVERTGVEETTFADVLVMLVSMAAIDGFPMVSCTLALAATSRLGACKLLLTEHKSNEIQQRIILNVSPDDIHYALRKD